MELSRIELLQQTLEQDPSNAFARYALALELSRSNAPLRAWEHFHHLLANRPDYAPVYLQAGLYLAKQNRRDEARKVLQKGIEVNQSQGNLHAQSELSAALEDLDSE